MYKTSINLCLVALIIISQRGSGRNDLPPSPPSNNSPISETIV